MHQIGNSDICFLLCRDENDEAGADMYIKVIAQYPERDIYPVHILHVLSVLDTATLCR